MSIETRTQQSEYDIAPEGREPDARQHAPSQVAYDEKVPNEPAGDALPLDGGLTLNDTEPQNQALQHSGQERILSGSEAGGTANASIEGGESAGAAIDSKDPAVTSAMANPDPSL